MQNLINSTYEHRLAFALHQIDNRGLLLEQKKLEIAKKHAEDELISNCNQLSNIMNMKIFIGKDNEPDKSLKSLNINAPTKVLETLKELGFNVPKVRKKNEETEEYEMVESVDKLVLQMILADPTRWPQGTQYSSAGNTGGDLIRLLLNTKETITFRNRYLNAKLWRNLYFCNSNVAATVTGRRGTKKNIFGLGGNNQNFPARGRLSDSWKECIISKPGTIFFIVDQISAEDWPVQALSENHTALDEMRREVNRHYKFASAIFGISVNDLKYLRSDKNPDLVSRTDAEMKYYFGKKGRHSNNYGTQARRMSEALAAEGYTVPQPMCKNILDIIDREDPNVKRIFHKYIQDELSKSTHCLKTPLGRERQFFGLRSGEKNYSTLNEAYAWIPQSTIGDNTGLAILFLEELRNFALSNSNVVQESHDSICQECADNESELVRVFQDTKNSFTRSITFHNGISVEIPIEGTLSFDWKNKVKLEHFTEEGMVEAYKKLKDSYQCGSTT